MGVLPMFPLGLVLLPGGVLPLQIFEPRYRKMVVDILEDDVNEPEFGVVMIERGREVGGGDQRATVATTARITDIRAQPDGRFGLIAIGVERIKVAAWLPDDPYPLADVERWPDDDAGLIDLAAVSDAVAEAHRRVRALNDLARSLGELVPPPDSEISDDPHLATYHLGSLSPLGPADRYRLLTAPTLSERLRVLSDALDDAEAAIRFRSS
jgi:Lon protease-like protein